MNPPGVQNAIGVFAGDYVDAMWCWEKYVVIDPKFVRPAEIQLLLGDASKAKKVLGWEPKVRFEELVTMMVEADVERLGEK